MTEAVTLPPSPSGPVDTIVFSNVTVVRNQEGQLSVYVGSEKMLGVSGTSITNGTLGIGVDMTRVRLSEENPTTPVVVPKDNVLQFPKFRKAQLVVDNTTPTEPPTIDGDSA